MIRRILGWAAVAGLVLALAAIRALELRLGSERGKLNATEVRAAAAEQIVAAEAEALQAERTRNHSDGYVQRGLAAWDKDDPAVAALWFVQALRLDQGNAERESAQRVRIASSMAHFPRLLSGEMPEIRSEKVFGRRRIEISGTMRNTVSIVDNQTGGETLHIMSDHGTVWSAIFSPDGTRVVTASGDNSARVWDSKTGRQIAAMDAGESSSFASSFVAAFSPDGTRVVSGGPEDTALIWDAATGTKIATIKNGELLMRGTFSGDGRRIVTADLKGARVWDAATGEPITPRVEQASWRPFAKFSPDGSRIVTADSDHSARVWDAATGNPVTPPLRHATEVTDAAFSPDGSRLVTTSIDRTAQIWDATTGQQLTPPMVHGNGVGLPSFSPDGRFVLTVDGDNLARIWEAASGKPITGPVVLSGYPVFAGFSSNGTRVVTLCAGEGARVWDVVAAPVPASVTIPGKLQYGEFSRDGKWILTADEGDKPKVWDAATGKPVCSLFDITGLVKFSPDGTRVYVESDNSAQVRDAASGKLLAELKLPNDQQLSVGAISPDGRRVAVKNEGDARSVQIWDMAAGKPTSAIMTCSAQVHYMVFSPDGMCLVTGAGTIAQIWDAATGKPVGGPIDDADQADYAQFSPDGKRLVLASKNHKLRIWDVATGKPVSPPIEKGNYSPDGGAVFSPDGTRLLISYYQDGVRVVDAVTGKPVSPYMETGVFVSRFSPDGRRVVTSSMFAKSSRVWDSTTGEPLTMPIELQSWAYEASFSPDGNRVATFYRSPLQIWQVGPCDWPIDRIERLAELTAGRRIDDSDALAHLTAAEWQDRWQSLQNEIPEFFRHDNAADVPATGPSTQP
jgi:WD40 repeat protein